MAQRWHTYTVKRTAIHIYLHYAALFAKFFVNLQVKTTPHPMAKEIQFILYNLPDGEGSVQAYIEGDTIWLTQKAMAILFDVTIPAVNQHLKNIYDSNELSTDSTIKKFLIVQQEGARQVRREQIFYNLDAIISVGYRVNSQKATRFRQCRQIPHLQRLPHPPRQRPHLCRPSQSKGRSRIRHLQPHPANRFRFRQRNPPSQRPEIARRGMNRPTIQRFLRRGANLWGGMVEKCAKFCKFAEIF